MKRLLFIAVLALTQWGCPSRYARPDDFDPAPAPLLTALERRAQALESLSGALHLEVWRDGERARLRQLVAVKRPDHLRLDALSPFDQPLSTLVSDGQVLSLYTMEDKRFRQGPATPANLARLLPVRLSPEEVVAFLRGEVPVIRHERAEVSWDEVEGRYCLTLTSGDATQRISFEPKAKRVTEVWLSRGGAQVYRAKMGDYQGEGDTAIPRRLRLEARDASLSVDVKVEDFRINPELPEAAFSLEPPRGVTVEPFD